MAFQLYRGGGGSKKIGKSHCALGMNPVLPFLPPRFKNLKALPGFDQCPLGC